MNNKTRKLKCWTTKKKTQDYDGLQKFQNQSTEWKYSVWIVRHSAERFQWVNVLFQECHISMAMQTSTQSQWTGTFPVMTTSYTLVQMVEKTHEKFHKVRSIIRAKSQSEDVPAVWQVEVQHQHWQSVQLMYLRDGRCRVQRVRPEIIRSNWWWEQEDALHGQHWQDRQWAEVPGDGHQEAHVYHCLTSPSSCNWRTSCAVTKSIPESVTSVVKATKIR